MSGARVVQEIFKKISHPQLTGTIIWEPMMADDDLAAANIQQELFQDSRVLHLWDVENVLGKIIANSMLEYTPIAWDIYLLYQPDAKWVDEKFPAPDFWMHQLEEDERLRLNSEVLQQKVKMAINNLSN